MGKHKKPRRSPHDLNVQPGDVCYAAVRLTDGIIKLGKSQNVVKRLKLQRPIGKMKLLGTAPGYTTLERRIHQHWARYSLKRITVNEDGKQRVRNTEWYTPAPELLDWINRGMPEHELVIEPCKPVKRRGKRQPTVRRHLIDPETLVLVTRHREPTPFEAKCNLEFQAVARDHAASEREHYLHRHHDQWAIYKSIYANRQRLAADITRAVLAPAELTVIRPSIERKAA